MTTHHILGPRIGCYIAEVTSFELGCIRSVFRFLELSLSFGELRPVFHHSVGFRRL